MEEENIDNEDTSKEAMPDICDCGECEECIKETGECNCGDCEVCMKDAEEIDAEDLFDDVEAEDLV